MSALVEGARALGIHLGPGQVAQFDQLQAALLDWNQRVNLTRITDPAEVEVKHFLDSLTAVIPVLPRLQAGESLRAIDVGTGGGFPGLPLKIAFPSLRLTLNEATRKKARFLEAVVDMLGLRDVEVQAVRAEELAQHPDHRDGYALATARALGRLPTVVELCGPFLEPGGLLVAQRKGDLEAEMLAAAPAFSALRLWSRAPILVGLAGLSDGRGLVVGEKHGPTPSRYPRRPGMAKKEPISR